MHSNEPCSLTTPALAQRLVELTGEERQILVDFLLHLDEFERRRAFLHAGYESLWAYCLKVLHLREGPAWRRIGSMRVLRRFPRLEPALRDGRLCLSTVTLLGPLLTEESLDELVARAAYRTKAEVEHLAATLQPRVAPREGIRKLPQAQQPRELLASIATDGSPTPHPSPLPVPRGEGDGTQSTPPTTTPTPTPTPTFGEPGPRGEGVMRHPRTGTPEVELRPISADRWSLRVTLDAQAKTDLETLASLLNHAKGRDLAAVLHEAIRCGIERHGRRKGAVSPARTRSAPELPASEAPPPGIRETIPAHVRREVWLRDGGRCAWTSADGHRCGSRWKLELDHVLPVARGGASTADNLRIVCKSHNLLHAEQTFGREHMARFAGAQLILG
jgi:HNH endonuclease